MAWSDGFANRRRRVSAVNPVAKICQEVYGPFTKKTSRKVLTGTGHFSSSLEVAREKDSGLIRAVWL